MVRLLMVTAGGGLGSLVRYLVVIAIMQRFAGRFPLGTFVVNITGSFLIGVLMPLLTGRFSLSPNWRLLLIVGFLGGYTTFSSFEYETFQSARAEAFGMALGYVVASVSLGYAGVWLGFRLASRV